MTWCATIGKVEVRNFRVTLERHIDDFGMLEKMKISFHILNHLLIYLMGVQFFTGFEEKHTVRTMNEHLEYPFSKIHGGKEFLTIFRILFSFLLKVLYALKYTRE